MSAIQSTMNSCMAGKPLDCAFAFKASKESLTSSLVALKTKPNDLKIEEVASAEVNREEIKSTTRQKRSVSE